MSGRPARVWQRLRYPDTMDEVALVHTVLRDRGTGTMVDVGAHHGSSLRLFANDGWRVHAFEPDPKNREQLERRWATAENVTIDPRAISEHDGALVDLFVSEVSAGISALAPFHPSHHVGASVETVRLDTYLAEIDEVTVLKTDTEGWDLPVLRTFPWDRLHPVAVVCEFEDRKTVPLGYAFDDLATFMEELGYVVYVSEWYPVVEYGRKHRWRRLRRYPTSLADPNAWGNFVCVDPALEQRLAKSTGWHTRLRIGLRNTGGRLRGRSDSDLRRS